MTNPNKIGTDPNTNLEVTLTLVGSHPNPEDRPLSPLFDRPRILGPSTLILFNIPRSLEGRPLSSLIDHPLI